MSTPTIMQRIGKAGKDYVSGLKQIPLNESEFSGLRDRAAQSRAVRELNAAPILPAPYVPAAMDKVNPMAKFGSRPGEKRLDYALKPMPVYDMGGDVPQTSLDQVRAKVGDVDPVDDGQKEKKPLKQFVQGLKPMGDISTGAQVSPTGPAQTTTVDSTETQIAPAVLHDDGGETVDADNVNVNDGKHQVAVLKEGEKVLTPEQAEVYDKEQAKKTVENPGAQTEDAHPTDETAVQPQAPAPDKPLPTASHEERVAIKKDQQDALGMGVSGLTQLGLANIHAKQLGLNPVAVGDEATPAGFDVNQMTAPKGLNQGAQAPGLPKMADAVGPTQPAAPAVKPDFKTQLAQLKQDHSAALAERTPEGKVKADYIQAQINDLQKNNPWGSAQNRPGFMGKLGHVASKIGNIAGDTFIPKIMVNIPGTDLNKQAQERGLQEQTAQDVATTEKANKPAGMPGYHQVTGGAIDPKHPELGPQVAFENEKNPADIVYQGPITPKTVGGGDKAAFQKTLAKTGNPDIAKGEKQLKVIAAAHDAGKISDEEYNNALAYIGSTANAPATQSQKAEVARYGGKTLVFTNKDGSRQGMSYGDAVEQGLDLNKAEVYSPLSSEKMRAANNSHQNAVQMADHYQTDMNAYSQIGTQQLADQQALQYLTSTIEDHPDMVTNLGNAIISALPKALGGKGEPLTAEATKEAGGQATQDAYAKMSPQARQLAADYFQTMLSHLQSVKDSQGSVPRSPKLIALEINAIPLPYLSKDESKPAFTRMYERMNNLHNDAVRFGQPERKEEEEAPTGAPKDGDTQQHGGFTFKFVGDSQQWVKQKPAGQ